MRFAIGVPWRGGDEVRERSWQFVRDHLATVTLNVVPVDDDPTAVFSRAACCNLAAGEAAHVGADVVIFHDADMIAPADTYPEMAQLAYDSGRMVIGYTEYRALGPATTRRALRGRTDPLTITPDATTNGWSQGGINAIRVDAFATVGGYDERFRGWGCEDFAFASACNIALGPNLRTPNPAVHLWHPHGTTTTDPDLIAANTALLGAYSGAGSIDELRNVQRTTEGNCCHVVRLP